jgi:hypothetical protein
MLSQNKNGPQSIIYYTVMRFTFQDELEECKKGFNRIVH